METYARSASAAMVAATLFLCALSASFRGTGLGLAWEFLLGVLLASMVVGLAFALVGLVGAVLSRAPRRVVTTALACALALFALRTIDWPGGLFEPMAIALRSLNFGWPDVLFYPAAVAFVGGAGAIAGWSRTKRLPALAVLAVFLNVAALAWLASPGHDPYTTTLGNPSRDAAESLRLADPSTPGRFVVETATYGSGSDRRRPEYAAAVSWKSQSVDASKMLPEWKGFKARARQWYWGFSIDTAPINGRVWLPRGSGPFPLVLIVHGNHRMEEHSDPGYAYLAELLASRGFVTVSVDENFINGTWSGDFRGREMPARGFLLLEHLKQWREWTRTAGHPMEGKVDLGRVALIGHSRGGEAVAIAAAFNRLSHFPDDATVTFDYGFGVRALVAIAQTDVRYDRRIELENVSFLALQGSYDSDEASFFGMRQFRRIALHPTPEAYRFKAGLYVHGANHGQFNTIWGRTDAGPPFSWLLNLAPIIPGDEQRAVAKVAIAAFLEATLHEEGDYVRFFREPRGASWLPDGTYVHRFEDSRFTPIADFEEDIDVTTGSALGIAIETRGLTTWREEELSFRDDDTQGTNAVVAGWKDAAASDDGDIPEYAIRSTNGDSFGVPGLEPGASLVFSSSGRLDAAGDTAETTETPVMSVVLEDADGDSATLEVEAASPLKVQFLKLAAQSRRQFGDVWEPTLQSYELPLERFTAKNPDIDLARLRVLRFRFDAVENAGVILDDVGFQRR